MFFSPYQPINIVLDMDRVRSNILFCQKINIILNIAGSVEFYSTLWNSALTKWANAPSVTRWVYTRINASLPVTLWPENSLDNKEHQSETRVYLIFEKQEYIRFSFDELSIKRKT